ncbi:Aminoacylase ACY1 and related metalloexopeptidases [Ceraceosorus bombacis]|uniref:Aminoacylase ACY1 and related metalloexopeptidases n=1 Tax=Ceraceosorus bombacis TaxID=401625 RepID=A0A0N7L949_9BASI|nr:Aminoacylase ACY1 and related metalloexopeptidases [Ceraceosorus bombacis]
MTGCKEKCLVGKRKADDKHGGRILTSPTFNKQPARAYKLLAALFTLPLLALPFLYLDAALSEPYVNRRFTSLLDEMSVAAYKSLDLERECPQVPINASALRFDLDAKGSRARARAEEDEARYATLLSESVKIDTSIGDNWPSPTEDPSLWEDKFGPFKQWMEQAFPLAHQNDRIHRDVVNQHGLVYTWKGSDENLKPVLITAHQDTVPVLEATLNQWRYPPHSGHVDEQGVVWGRGSYDAKAWLVGIMSALERLLSEESKFVPKRGIVIAFGFDEEASGPQGARHIGAHLEKVWGKDSFAFLLDEGTPNLSSSSGYGVPIALVGTEEKGAMHVTLRVESAGGHSSISPRHTSIGLLSAILAELERYPERVRLGKKVGDDSAHLNTLMCLVDSPVMDPALKRALRNLAWAKRSVRANARLATSDDGHTTRKGFTVSTFLDSLRHDPHGLRRIARAEDAVKAVLPRNLANPFFTTHAIDVIQGGVKINALPPVASASVDHRIAPCSLVQPWGEKVDAKSWWMSHMCENPPKQFSVRWQDQCEGFVTYDGTGGKLVIEAWESPLEPAPVTPTQGKDAKAWRLLSSVIRQTYPTDHTGQEVRVAPAMMQGNTDTRHYWALTRNIFRYSPSSFEKDPSGLGTVKGVHAENEHYATKGSRLSKFYQEIISRADAEEF